MVARAWGGLVLLVAACDRSPECPEGMALLPAGPAVIGTPNPRLGWQRPQQTVQLGAFCIDRYEYPNVAGQKPRSHVTWPEAEALCAQAGKRLCREDEWERACRGPTGRRYSYGEQRDAARCNTPIEGGGPGADGPPIAASGASPGCKTEEGVYDLNGNLSEWTADGYRGPPEPFNRAATPDPETWRVLRGGTMWSQTFYGQDCLSRHGHDASFQNMDDGLRCCADPG